MARIGLICTYSKNRELKCKHTQNTTLYCQECVWITHVHRIKEQVQRKQMRHGRTTMKVRQHSALPRQVFHEQAEETIDNKCLRRMISLVLWYTHFI